MGFETRAVHAGHGNDPQTGAISFPIYQTSTFSQEIPGAPRLFQDRELSYGRSENPIRTALENAVAELEGADYGIAFSSGLAAINAVIQLLNSGDHVIAVRDLYGGAYRQFTKVHAKFGIEFSFVDGTDISEIEEAIRPETALIWLETPSNPLLNITDIKAVVELAEVSQVKVLVDNTFATPFLQQPLSLGADLVLHSTTKYINGHSDVVNGIVVTHDKQLWRDLKFLQNAVGAIPGPQDCFLVLRGLKTLGLRMRQHCANAEGIAKWLQAHPGVGRVYFPGLDVHPGHELASKQMSGYGAMVSFELDAGLDKVFSLLQELKLFTLAESLGGVKSLICHPPTMTHASMDQAARHAAGISDGLIRLSAGIENVEDLIADLDRTFKRVLHTAPVLSTNGGPS